MIASEPISKAAKRGNRHSDLANGTHLTASEFMRRYEASPEIKKAELINGIVYMASPVRADLHGVPDNLIQTWIGSYSFATPGVKAASNTTIRLGTDDVPQPDGLLRILPESGGQSRQDSKGYIVGAPELVVEVAASTASIDAHEKLTSYRRGDVREYVLWRTEDEAVDWWVLEDDDYRPLAAGVDGILKSRVFPGLWLDPRALLAGDGAKVLAALQSGLQSAEHAAFIKQLSAESRPGR
jgi:Uma2 family endonuclease